MAVIPGRPKGEPEIFAAIQVAQLRLSMLRIAPNDRYEKRRLTRPIGSGHGIPLQRLDIPRMGGLSDARQAHLLQLLVDPDSGLVGPADHGKPAQDARECDEYANRTSMCGERSFWFDMRSPTAFSLEHECLSKPYSKLLRIEL